MPATCRSAATPINAIPNQRNQPRLRSTTPMYWSTSSSQRRDYLDALIATGCTPDEWTAATLTDRPDRA
jgi:hypothetical protein